MKSFLIACILTVLLCAACGVGTNNSNPTISASQSTGCSDIRSNTCNITLTYNTGGQTGLSIGTSGTTYPNEFRMSTESCVTTNQPYNQTCTFPVTLGQSNSQGNSETFAFTFGTAKSGQITISYSAGF